MAISPIEDLLSYAKNWYNEDAWSDDSVTPGLFPTYEGSEPQVRWNYQYHPEKIKRYINGTLIPFLNLVVAAVNDLVEVSVPDNSITATKIAHPTEGAPNVYGVETQNIAPSAVTANKLSKIADLAGAAVGTDAIQQGAVTLSKMATGSVNTDQLVDGAVRQGKIYAGAVTNANLYTDIVPESVGFVVGTGDPTQDPTLISEGQIYIKLES